MKRRKKLRRGEPRYTTKFLEEKAKKREQIKIGKEILGFPKITGKKVPKVDVPHYIVLGLDYKPFTWSVPNV